MNYSEAIKYLDTLLDYERIGPEKIEGEFDLDKIRGVLKELGEPQKNYRSVHVAGTKGKGSVCAFTSSILEAEGRRVGLFTSPHLKDVNERIQINNVMISDDDFADIVEQVSVIIDPDKFTYFEVLTIAAIKYFSDKKVDLAVFEVGLGGRLDATNVLEPDACCITSIGYDHMGVLGGTIEHIAKEKAAIIKEGVPCACAPQRPEVLRVIKDKCRMESSVLTLAGRDILWRTQKVSQAGNKFTITTKSREYKGCSIALAGKFQMENACLAVGIYENLCTEPDEKAVEKGLKEAFLPGRMEVLSKRPVIVIDGAQTAESAKELKYSVEEIFKYDKLILLLGLSRDKDAQAVCKELFPLADEVIVTKSSSRRAQDPHVLRGFAKGMKAKIALDSKEALGLALKSAGENDLILATGSFYLIAEVRELVLRKEKGKGKKENKP